MLPSKVTVNAGRFLSSRRLGVGLLVPILLLLPISESAAQEPAPARKAISAEARNFKKTIAALPENFTTLDTHELLGLRIELTACVDLHAEELTRQDLTAVLHPQASGRSDQAAFALRELERAAANLADYRRHLQLESA